MAAKEFLSKNEISYTEIDLTKQPEKEAELKERTGSKIVPSFVIKFGGFAGIFKKPKVFIGFEVNEKVLKKLLQ
ncbi:glutaredoxin family protein [Neobacillus sp. SM06]|uniref:glutaredoxin family protein n=1 Tax=Neobacillus sp. SM06 TaxID=3422492 RepID=UPI003D2E60ED